MGKHGDGGGYEEGKGAGGSRRKGRGLWGRKLSEKGRPGDSRKDVGVAGGGREQAEQPGSGDPGRAEQKGPGSQAGRGGQWGRREASAERERKLAKGEDPGAQDTGWEGTKLGKGGSGEGRFFEPSARSDAREGRAKLPASRRPVVPESAAGAGRAEEFPPAAVAMMRTAAMAASEQPLPRGPQLRTYRLRLCGPAAAEAAAAAGGRCSPGLRPPPPPRARGRRCPLAAAPRTASPAANQRRAAPFGNFFPGPGAARPRGGPRRAGGGVLGGSRCWAEVLAELGGCMGCSLDTGGNWLGLAGHLKKI